MKPSKSSPVQIARLGLMLVISSPSGAGRATFHQKIARCGDMSLQ
ncbi:guanylate kinase, partial [Rhizobium ruizarguesonis]